MKIRLSTQQVQKQILAPSMQQAIEILLLPLTELNYSIEQEMQGNPLLEVEDEHLINLIAQVEYQLYRRNDSLPNHSTPLSSQSEDDERMEERPIKKEISLEELLVQQLIIETSDPLERKIGEFIIGNLNEDGYLQSNLIEIAQACQTEDLNLVEKILDKIKNSEPLGIASRNLEECLLAQAKVKCPAKIELISLILKDHLEDLAKKRYAKIAKELKVSSDKIKSAAKLIASLEPRPARNYRPVSNQIYIKPDLFIVKDENEEFKVILNNEDIVRIRISPVYRKMLQNQHLSPEEREFLKEKLKSALVFIKSVEHRGQTLLKIGQYILEKQKDFFVNGHQSLVPLRLKDVALFLNHSESTISRAINNKYAETPKGLLPLKFFFSQAVSVSETSEDPNSTSTPNACSRSIKEEIKELIEAEDPSSPLSDQDIQNYFKQKGLNIARRTINKYRKVLNILPSYLRKENK